MKQLLTALLISITFAAHAQNVNIPDSNFRAALISLGVDTNNDGEIQQSEAEAVTSLEIQPYPQVIRDFTGILSFTNLESFSCSYMLVPSIDMHGLQRLRRLIFPWSGVVSVNVADCILLDTLNLDFGESLLYLNASNTAIKNLSLSMLLGARLQEVNLSNCDSLLTVYPGNTAITLLNINDCHNIRSVTQAHAVLNLLARNCTSLRELTYSSGGASFYKIDVTNCVSLETLIMGEGMSFEDLDLSTCPNIKNLSILGANIVDHCLNVNLKNGTRMTNCTISAFNFSGNGLPPCINICADEFEMDSVSNWLHIVQMENPALVNVNPYCSFSPVANYNTIKGRISLDAGSGCDSTSRGLPGIPVSIIGTNGYSIANYTGNVGEYKHYFFSGNYTVRPYFPYPYFTLNPASATVNFDTANSITAIKDFCVQPNGVHNDLEISFMPSWPPARPGFAAAYILMYKNRGTTTLSGNVGLNYDNNKMNFVSASQIVATQSTGQLNWSYNNLQPFERRTIDVNFSLLPPPVNNIDDTLVYLASITPSANDETPYDNSFILPQRILGSYDPNEKQCIEGSKIDISKIGDYLHYIIHFQNEGTDTAFNVVVADTLSNNLNWNSFEFVGSSHTANVKLSNNKLEFFFENIKLPYKTIDEPGSNGWVAFKIKPKPSVVVGDSINNTAAIYFDFNFPVITNKATTIVSNASSPVPVKLEYFSLNKNNTANQLQWKVNCSSTSVTFVMERSIDGIHFNAIGNISSTELRCQLPFTFTDDNPAAGKNYYRLKITDAEGISFYSRILVTGNNKAAIEITAVTNGTVYLNSNKQQMVSVKLVAADGRIMMQQKQTVNAGSSNIDLPLKNITSGIYTMILYTAEGEVITRRLML